SEQEDNMGQASRIKMKGIENILVFNFDSTPLKNKLVTQAALHLKATEKNVMVRKVGFSTLATPWNEGQAPREAQAGAGDSCFKSPAYNTGILWAGPDSCFLDALWGRGGTLWMQSYATPGEELWYTLKFDGRLLEACAAGLSSGLAVSDDNGQTMSIHKNLSAGGNFSNNYFFSREQRNAQPY